MGGHGTDGAKRSERRKRLLTLIGAMLVFITFIVKDGLQERKRTLVDSIDAAEAVFSIRQDTAIVNSAVRDLAHDVEELKNSKERRYSLPGNGEVIDRLFKLGSRLDEGNLGLHNGEYLLARLPDDPEGRQKLESLIKSTDKAKREIESAMKLILYDPGNTRDSMRVYVQRLRQASDEAEQLEPRVTTLEVEAKSFSGFVLDRAMGAKKRSEQSYRHVTLVSYVLYVLGWGLGLFGRLYGLEGLVNE